MVYLPTTLIAGQAGHVAHSNQAYELLNQIQNAASTRVINVLKPPAAISAVAAVGDGTTDDNVALQNIFDWLKGARSETHIVWFPFLNAAGSSAKYMTSKPLRVWTETHIQGPATIKAHPSFDWVNHPYYLDPLYKPEGVQQPGDIALMELWNDGTKRGGTSRLFLNDITLDGANQVGSLGLLSKMQQPSYTLKLRIDRCQKAGWALWGQQVDALFTIIVDCPVGLYLGPDIGGLGTFGAAGTSCKFMSFYTLNIETYTDTAIRMDCDGPNWFYSLHFEVTAGATNCNILDAREGGWTIRNGWGTHGGNTNHIFVIGDKSPTPGIRDTNYLIEDFRLGGTNTGGQLMIDDKVVGYTRLVDLQRTVDSFRRAFQGDTQYDYDAAWELIGDEGGYVRIGGLKGGTSAPTGHSGAQLTVKANTGQDEPAVRFLGSDGTLRTGVGQLGNLFLGTYTNGTRPDASLLANGSVIFNTDDNAPNFVGASVWRDAMGIPT